jgi:membrane fusion protein (multidrug efflux system)
VSSSTTVPSSPVSTAPVVAAESVPAKSSLALKQYLAIGIVLLLVVLALWYYFSGRVTTDDAQVDCHITAAASLVSGYVVQLAINDNVMVKQGDLLVQIDPREYQAEVDQAKASLEVAEAQARSAELQIGLTQQTTTYSTGGAAAQKDSDSADYARAEAQLAQAATANLMQAQANVAAKRATNERAQSDLERYKPLLGTDDVSKFQFDAVDSTARVAKSDLEAAEQELAAAQQNVEISRANSRSSQAKLARSQSQLLETKARERQVPITEAAYKSAVANAARAKALLEHAELNLNYARIVAPIGGQITQKSVDLGQYVSPGQLLFTIVPLDQVYVTANFKETQLAHVAPGQKVSFRVDTYPDEFEGVVDSIAGATGSRQALLPPQNATGNFVKVVQRIPVKILVKPGQHPSIVLRPGMNVEATIYTR